MSPAVDAILQLEPAPCEGSWSYIMRFTVCPFCGVASETAHDSQEACIRALQDEIQRTREILTQVGDSGRFRPIPIAEREDDEEPQPS